MNSSANSRLRGPWCASHEACGSARPLNRNVRPLLTWPQTAGHVQVRSEYWAYWSWRWHSSPTRCSGHRLPQASKAWRCFVTNASTVIGGRPPIRSTKSLVPAKMPLVWSIATSRKCCTRNSLPGRPVMLSVSA